MQILLLKNGRGNYCFSVCHGEIFIEVSYIFMWLCTTSAKASTVRSVYCAYFGVMVDNILNNDFTLRHLYKCKLKSGYVLGAY